MSATTSSEATPTTTTGRDANGRFAKGNLGGPGNPFARQCAHFRKVLHEMVTDQDIRDLAATLLLQAREGNLGAIKLVFSYVIGKPTPAPDPDRLSVDEWRLMCEGVPTTEEASAVNTGLPLEVGLKMARLNRNVQDAQQTRQLLEQLGMPEQGQAYEESVLGPRVEPAEQGPPSPNGTTTEQPPSANGTAGAALSANGVERRPPSPNGERVEEAPLPNGEAVGAVLEQLFGVMTEAERDWFQDFLEERFAPYGPPPSANGSRGREGRVPVTD
jgi:hypothetical protein